MKKYFTEPEINVRWLDFEDVTTESGVPSTDGVELAKSALKSNGATQTKVVDILSKITL